MGLRDYSAQVEREVRRGLKQALRDTVQSIVDDMKVQMKDVKSGRKYRKPHTKHATWTASAPGEAPAIVTGKLRDSLTYSITRESGEIMGRVGSVYGGKIPIWLESGTRKIKKRPFLKPAFKRGLITLQKTLSLKAYD